MVALSSGETDIMRMVCLGMTNREIADVRCYALSTVKNQLVKIYEKLGACNKAQAVTLFLRREG